MVWTFAKALAIELAARHRSLMTSEYRVASRPAGRVLVDYNQNRWGATLASVYSVRPTPRATVSTPITWAEVAAGIETDDFRLDNVPKRFAEIGDLWKPLLHAKGPNQSGAVLQVNGNRVGRRRPQSLDASVPGNSWSALLMATAALAPSAGCDDGELHVVRCVAGHVHSGTPVLPRWSVLSFPRVRLHPRRRGRGFEAAAWSR